MRIPTSVNVMACVTAIPFGLAIRSTVIQAREQAEAAAEQKRIVLELEQQRAAEQAEEARLAAAEKAKHVAMLASLFGKDRATLGTAFGFALDDAPSGDAITKAETALIDLIPVIERGKDDRVIGVALKIGAYDCDTIRDRLDAAWGKGELDWSWSDPAHHHRATLSSTDCVLRFSDYVEVGEWLKLVPTDLVGKPVAEALRVLGPAQEMADDELEWHLPATPGGSDTTKYQLRVIDNIVKQISVNTDVIPDEVQKLVDAATARFKSKPALDADTSTRVWTWKRTPPTSIESDGSMLLLQIGTYE